jgi:hypothetical protein
MPELGIAGNILDGSITSTSTSESPSKKLSEAIDVVSAPSTPTVSTGTTDQVIY